MNPIRTIIHQAPVIPQAALRIDGQKLAQSLWAARLQGALLLMALFGLLVGTGYVLAGVAGSLLALSLTALLWLFSPNTPWTALRQARLVPIGTREAPQLERYKNWLAQRAGLEQSPALYLEDSNQINAYTMDQGSNNLIVLTRGLLRALTSRETAGVLAHEMAHIAHRDLSLLKTAGLISAVTKSMSQLGFLLCLAYLPLSLALGIELPWLGLVLLLAAPSLSLLVSVAIARKRELLADLGAAQLTGDALGLASALHKIRANQGKIKHFFPQVMANQSPWLATHPATEERIQRLEALLPQNRLGQR